MSAIEGASAGFIATLYKGAKFANLDTTTAVQAATASAAGNLVLDVSSMGGLGKERANITYPIYGRDTEGSISGQVAATTFDFTVTLSADNAGHKAIRDDAGTTVYSWVVKLPKDGNTSFMIFNGTIGNATIEPPIDGVINMACSVNLANGYRWVDSA